MSKNYYEILDLQRTATNEQIASAFRRLALKFHPLKNPTDLATNSQRFTEICEAYDVLSNGERKAIYDKFGEFGLKEGVPTKEGKMIGGYRFPGNSYEIFDQFFGSTNPWTDKLEFDGSDQFGSMFGDAFGGQNQPKTPVPKDIEVELDCTLYEFYNGCIKKIEYDRQALQHDGKTTKTQREEMNIQVKPGYSEKTVLKFESKGNEAHAHYPSHLIVKFKQVPHENYKRANNDLIYNHKILLEEALLSQAIKIKSLDGRTIIVTHDEIISPQTIKCVREEGMPICNENKEDLMKHLQTVEEMAKGDLYIKFDIIFPQKLKNEYKQVIVQALRDNAEAFE